MLCIIFCSYHGDDGNHYSSLLRPSRRPRAALAGGPRPTGAPKMLTIESGRSNNHRNNNNEHNNATTTTTTTNDNNHSDNNSSATSHRGAASSPERQCA